MALRAPVRLTPPPPGAVVYPASDGKPLGETTWHIDAIFDLLGTLRSHFVGRADAFVASNLFLYFQEGQPKARVAPDLMVVLGVPKRHRRIYRLWDEGKVPDLVVEVTSRATRREDQGMKRDLYERLAVAEYVLYDPVGEYLQPPLRGLRLVGRRYEEIVPDSDGGLSSQVLGLTLRQRDGELRLHDPVADRWLLSPAEEAAARQAEAAARQVEAAARQAAEAEVAQLRAELARRTGPGWQG